VSFVHQNAVDENVNVISIREYIQAVPLAVRIVYVVRAAETDRIFPRRVAPKPVDPVAILCVKGLGCSVRLPNGLSVLAVLDVARDGNRHWLSLLVVAVDQNKIADPAFDNLHFE
jgi:hypothetical protein